MSSTTTTNTYQGHWTYKTPDRSSLTQGDLLDRTPALLGILRDVHPYFASHQRYLHFMLVTQSCDLVLRERDRCKAPYLTIAAVRGLGDVVLRKEIPRIADGRHYGKYIQKSAETRINNALESLLNNNDPNYFFLRADQQQELGVDCCACLRVTIPLKSEHYGILLDAKRGQLNDTFQAKLGWLVGTCYSRVGTEDWSNDAQRKQQFKELRNAITDSIEYIDDKRFDAVVELMDKEKRIKDVAAFAELKDDARATIPNRTDLFGAAFDKTWPIDMEVPDAGALRNEILSDETLSAIKESMPINHAAANDGRVPPNQIVSLRAALTPIIEDAIKRAWPKRSVPKRSIFLARLQQKTEFSKALRDK